MKVMKKNRTADLNNTNLRRKAPLVSIAVIGNGRLGQSLAAAITSQAGGYQLVAHIGARAKSFAALKANDGPEIIFIVCADRFISLVAKRVLKSCGPNTRLLVHCAGSLSSTILPTREGVSRLMLHPIQSFSSRSPTSLRSIAFGYETSDREAAKFAITFTKALERISLLPLNADQLPLYHATNVIASNFITLLGFGIESLAPLIAMSPIALKGALAPLMRTSLENVLSGAATEVLTGPIARGDVDTITMHRDALRKAGCNDLLRIYDTFVTLARELS